MDKGSQITLLGKLSEKSTACEGATAIAGMVRLPKLGCTAHVDETRMEAYNRAWALLDHFYYVTGGEFFAVRFKSSLQSSLL